MKRKRDGWKAREIRLEEEEGRMKEGEFEREREREREKRGKEERRKGGKDLLRFMFVDLCLCFKAGK